MITTLLLVSQLASFAQLAVWQKVSPPVLHQGHWQSCDREERVLDHMLNGKLVWSIHLGPSDEFALYDHFIDGEHDHNDHANLLGSSYRYSSIVSHSGRTWTIPKLKLWINIVAAGGSRDECEAFWIRIESKP